MVGTKKISITDAWKNLVRAVIGDIEDDFREDLVSDFEWTGGIDSCDETVEAHLEAFENPWMTIYGKLNGKSGNPTEMMQEVKEDEFLKWRLKNPNYCPPDKSSIATAAKVAADWWRYQLYPTTKNDLILDKRKNAFRNFIYDMLYKELSRRRVAEVIICLNGTFDPAPYNRYRDRLRPYVNLNAETLTPIGIQTRWLPDYFISMGVSRNSISVYYRDPEKEDDYISF